MDLRCGLPDRAGTFAHAVRRGLLTRSRSTDSHPAELPKQKNAKTIAVLDATAIEQLVAAGTSPRWRAALALAGYGGLRLGELRGLRWRDVDRKAGTVTVRRSLLPDGTAKAPKTNAGTRVVPMLPALRRRLVSLELKSPHTDASDYVVATAEGEPVQERNLRRALEDAKTAAKLDEGEERLSWHSLRHSFASMLATELELPGDYARASDRARRRRLHSPGVRARCSRRCWDRRRCARARGRRWRRRLGVGAFAR